MWILAEKPPTLWIFGWIFLPSQGNRTQKIHRKIPPQNSPGNLFGQSPLGFLQKPFLDKYLHCQILCKNRLQGGKDQAGNACRSTGIPASANFSHCLSGPPNLPWNSRECMNKFKAALTTLTKDFPSATRSRMEILTKENLVEAKTAPTAVSRTFTPLVRETRFP